MALAWQNPALMAARIQSTIVVPCFNEAGRMDVDSFEAHLDSHADSGFVFVNDGSTDGTGEMLDRVHARAGDRALVVHLASNQGKAEAVRQGVLRAFENESTWIGYWDADLATPLDAIADLRGALEHDPAARLVMGSRVKLLGRSIERSAVRHYLGRVFATAASRFLRLPVYDTQCGAKLMRASDLMRWLFERPFKTRWVFDVELIARMRLVTDTDASYTPETAVIEYPLHQWHDVRGSKIHWYDFPRSGFGLMRLWLHYRVFGKRRARPS